MTSSTPPSRSVRATRSRNVSFAAIGSSAFVRPMRTDLPAARMMPGIIGTRSYLHYNRPHERRPTSYALPALWRADGFERSAAWKPVEAGSILGVSKLRTPLLDDIPFAAGRPGRRRTAHRRHRRKTCQGINPRQKFGYHMDFFLQDEDDEVVDDEDF